MSTHDWRQWTPATMPSGPRWRLIRFDQVGADGKPQGKAIECTSPAGGVRSFATEADAQRVADYLNAEAGESADA